MTQLEIVLNLYKEDLIDIKYKYAVDLLKLLSDEDYMLLCEDNPELINPISQEGGDLYLRREDVLDNLISTFIRYIEDAEPNPDKMNWDELVQYIEANTPSLGIEYLRNFARQIKQDIKN